MERLTRLTEAQGFYVSDITTVCTTAEGCSGDAIERLAKFENLYDHLTQRRKEIPTELETLRAAGKNKTVTFKELLTEKMIIDMLLNQLVRHGLD